MTKSVPGTSLLFRRGETRPSDTSRAAQGAQGSAGECLGQEPDAAHPFLSADARAALADSLELERAIDAEGLDQPRALFLHADSIQYAKKDDESSQD